MISSTIPATNINYLYSGSGSGTKQPVILIHGAYCDARMWVDNYMTFFSERGHEVYAVHLKNTDSISSFSTLFSYSLREFADRLHQLIEFVGGTPLLIGHSMGGLVIQKYLTHYSGEIAGACLLASLPPFGMKNTLLKMIREPEILLAYTVVTLTPGIARKGEAPRGLLSNRVDEEKRKTLQSILVRESGVALSNAVMPGIDTRAVANVPLQVWGAELDNLALPDDVKKMAWMYGVVANIRENTGHFMVFEPDWMEVAARIVDELL